MWERLVITHNVLISVHGDECMQGGICMVAIVKVDATACIYNLPWLLIVNSIYGVTSLIRQLGISSIFLKNHTLSRKNQVHAYCSTSMMLYISALQSQVVNGRQLFRHSIRASFTYHLSGKHCKRMASLYKHTGNTLGGVSPTWKSKSKISRIEF